MVQKVTPIQGALSAHDFTSNNGGRKMSTGQFCYLIYCHQDNVHMAVVMVAVTLK